MKSLYRHSAGAVLRKNGVPGLFGWFRRWMSVPVSSFLQKPVGPPLLATILVTYRCNASCSMCDFRKRIRGGGSELGEREMKNILDGLAGLGIGAAGFTGGETLLRSDLTSLLSHSVNLGLITHLNTNGFLVNTESAAALLETGIHSVNVSIDYPDPARHDSARGTPGLFDAAVNALNVFAEARQRAGGNVRIVAVASAGPDNIDELPDLAGKCTDWGADALGLIPRHERIKPGSAPRPDADPDAGRVWEERILPLLLAFQRRGIIDNSASYLKMFKLFFKGRKLPFPCLAGYNSIAVDCYGDVYPCFPFAGAGYGGMHLPHEDDHSSPVSRFRSLWKSRDYSALRKNTTRCGACFWNCQTELTLLHRPVFVARSLTGL